ncbi:hypothetical protein D3C87_75440 [compost metagenome]
MIKVMQCKCCKKYEDDLVEGLCIECEDYGTGNHHDPMAEEFYQYMNPAHNEDEDNFHWMDEDNLEDIYDPHAYEYDYDPF